MPPKKDKPGVCAYPGCTKPVAETDFLYCGGHVLWPLDGGSRPKSPPKKIRKK